MSNKLNQEAKNIQSILNRHGYQVDWNEKFDLNIYKAKVVLKKEQSISHHFFLFLLTALIAGYFVLAGRMIGLSLFFLNAFFYIISKNKKELDRAENSNDSISLTESVIQIENQEEQSVQIMAEEIDEIEITIFGNKNPFRGSLRLKGSEFGEVMLFDLAADNKRYLEDDLNKLVDYIHLKMYNDSEESTPEV